MKAFEEWWSKQEVSGYNPGSQYAYEMAWRAALEWAKNHAYGRDSLSVIRLIKKELEVTDESV